MNVSNYLPITNESAGLEKSIQDDNANFNSYVQGVISLQNEMEKIRQSKEKDVYKLIGSGVAFYQWNKQRNIAWESFKDHRGDGQSIEVRELKEAEDDAIENLTKQTINKQKSEANKLIKVSEVNNEDLHPDDLEALQSSTLQHSERKLLTELANKVGGYYAESLHKLQYKSGTDGQWKTLGLAGNADEFEQGIDGFNILMYQKAAELTNNQRLIKEILYPKLVEFESSERTKWTTNKREAVKARHNLEVKNEFATELRRTDNAVTAYYDMLEINKGKWALGNNKYDNLGNRREVTGWMVDLIEKGIIDRTQVDPVLDSVPKVKGNKKSFRDFWTIDADMIAGALRTQENKTIRDRIQEETTNLNIHYLNSKKEWGDKVPTNEQVTEARNDSISKYGRASSNYDSILTRQDQESLFDLEDLKDRFNNGEQITTDDIQGITDGTGPGENFAEQAESLVKRSQNKLTLSGLSGRDSFIKGAITQYTGKTYGPLDAKDLRYDTLTINSKNAYNTAYELSRGSGQPHSAAVSAAEKEVMRALKAKELDSRVFTPEDIGITQALQSTVSALSKNPSLINKDEPLPGEELAFEKVAEWYKNGGKGEPIGFYKALVDSRALKGHPAGRNWKDLMEHRWKLSGAKIDEDALSKRVKELRLDYQNRLKNNNPSDTLRVVGDDPEFSKDLQELSKHKEYDYNYIRKEGNEGPIETDKPLTEHNIVEVLDLIKNDHDTLGIYGLSGIQVISALEGMTWDPYETKFDEKFQDKIMKALLRVEANRRNSTKGVDVSWNNLVNIDEEATLAYQKATGITDPWLQLDTFPQEIAMAAIDMLEPDAQTTTTVT